MSKDIMYYVETECGAILEACPNDLQAIEIAKASYGEFLKKVRRATQDDVGCISAMGGYIPDAKVQPSKVNPNANILLYPLSKFYVR